MSLPKHLNAALSDQERRLLINKLLKEEFGSLHPIWVERHLALLANLRGIFGNDLDKPIILGVIGQFMFKNSLDVVPDYDAHLAGQGLRPIRLTNMESIANSAGIPRESVRRKVNELIKEGWLTRDLRGGLQVTAQAAEELDASTKHIYRLISDMFDTVVQLLAERGEAYVVTGDKGFCDKPE